jgi:hypothetical protein
MLQLKIAFPKYFHAALLTSNTAFFAASLLDSPAKHHIARYSCASIEFHHRQN